MDPVLLATSTRTADALPRLKAMAAAVRPGHAVKARYVSLGRVHAAIVAVGEPTAPTVFHSGDGALSLLLAGECRLSDERTWTSAVRTTSGSQWPAFFEAYAKDSAACFRQLEGLFSGIVLDRRSGTARIFTNRYGIERLYVTTTGDEWAIASCARALLPLQESARAFDRDGLADYLQFGCLTGDRTLFKGIEALPTGADWIASEGGLECRRYFTPARWEQQPPCSQADFADAFDAALARCAPAYFSAPGTVGIALTGGVDTRVIASMRPRTAPIVTYTYAADEGTTIDAVLAARAARRMGLPHHLVRLSREFFDEFARVADRTILLSDGTCSVLAAHELDLSAGARALSPIRLTGVFGGEILKRVSLLKAEPLPAGLLEPGVLERTGASGSALPEVHPVTAAAFRQGQWQTAGVLAACRSELTFRTPYLENAVVALAYRCPGGLDAVRLAFDVMARHDPVLTALPTDRGRRPSGGALSDRALGFLAELSFKVEYRFNEGMPAMAGRVLDPLTSWLYGRRSPLAPHKYLRYRYWLRTRLRSYLHDAIAASRASSLWNPRMLDTLVEEHVSGRRNHTVAINRVLSLSAVERLLLARRGSETVSAGDWWEPLDRIPAPAAIDGGASLSHG